jgi:anhydro-N-acetylmuramic acid kinase
MLRPYTVEERGLIEGAVTAARDLTDRNARPAPLAEAERAVTTAHLVGPRQYTVRHRLAPTDIDVAGFHGQTLLHRPHEGQTLQIGDGAWLARESGIDVVYDMRANDMVHGGQGATLVSVYHRALAKGCRSRTARRRGQYRQCRQCDVDWRRGRHDRIRHRTRQCDAGRLGRWTFKCPHRPRGRLAAQGTVSQPVLDRLLSSDYFEKKPLKPLDRNDFFISALFDLSLEDGAVTLTAFTAEALAGLRRHMPAEPKAWIICGGGSRNPVMMKKIRSRLSAPVCDADALG